MEAATEDFSAAFLDSSALETAAEDSLAAFLEAATEDSLAALLEAAMEEDSSNFFLTLYFLFL